MPLSDASLRKLTAHLAQTGSPEGFVPVKRKRNDNAEWRLQRDCYKWWQYVADGLGLDSRLLFSIPNGSVLGATYESRVIRAKMLKLSGMTSGIPDLFLASPRRGFAGLFIELKDGNKGECSDEQLAIHRVLKFAGYDVRVCRTLNEFKKTVADYTAP